MTAKTTIRAAESCKEKAARYDAYFLNQYRERRQRCAKDLAEADAALAIAERQFADGEMVTGRETNHVE